MSTISLSRRARFDLATLVVAGVASSAFFLLAALDAPLPAPRIDPPQVAAAPALPQHAIVPRAIAPKPAPAAMRVNANVRPPQSRLARFLLGDGRATVQPFPLREAER